MDTGRGQQWGALAALVFTVCCPQQSAAQATITVNTTQQGITNGQCSLQEAIYASEFKSNTAINQTSPDNAYTTGCIAGTGNGDTIVLPAGAVFTFDHLWDGDAHNKFGPTATPIILSKITIEGNGATLQWQETFDPGNSRLFAVGTGDGPFGVSGTGNLTLKNVHVRGFHVRGGYGYTGGGGGLGAGGAIYVNEAFLTVENSTFENNGALGGDAVRIDPYDSGGGGGGLSGNGGEGCHIAGGGGGGSRGNGGFGAGAACNANDSGAGGGGGGTVFYGKDGQTGDQGGIHGVGGFRCGGDGGDVSNDGHDASCPGGGGGGGADLCWSLFWCRANGSGGDYGGGGGGCSGNGGQGGFGGGGGSGGQYAFFTSGGSGGFGGGGGAAPCTFCSSAPGKGGAFGGHADERNGGGGALGGAIFNHNGTVQVHNSTFFNNWVARGVGGGGSAANGADAGGAIFSLDNTLEVTNCTFSGNQATGSGAAIVVYSDEGDEGGPGGGGAPVSFILNNTIIANNGNNECFTTGSMFVKGAGNLIMQNGSGTGQFSPCPGMVVFSDPQVQPLQLNSPGNTPTMAIFPRSSAFNKADPGTSLQRDQRGVLRNLGG